MPKPQMALTESEKNYESKKNAEPKSDWPGILFKSKLTVIILPVQEQVLLPVLEQGPLLERVQELEPLQGQELEQAPLLELGYLAQPPAPRVEMFLLPIFLRIFGSLPIRPDSRYLPLRFSKFSYNMS
ncbi:MAG: hypothetical protein ACR65O_05870 [Methylomicrobium sp.]